MQSPLIIGEPRSCGWPKLDPKAGDRTRGLGADHHGFLNGNSRRNHGSTGMNGSSRCSSAKNPSRERLLQFFRIPTKQAERATTPRGVCSGDGVRRLEARESN